MDTNNSTKPKTTLKPVSRAHPCALCGGTHKCSRGADGLLVCGRQGGEVAGFVRLGPAKGNPEFTLYRAEGDPLLNGRPPPPANGRHVDWQARAAKLARAFTPERRRELAEELGLPEAALAGHGIGWAAEGPHKGDDGRPLGPCYTFPLQDGRGNVVGIAGRYPGGAKRTFPGGKGGLFLPAGWQGRDGPVLLPEGPSDALALTAMNLAAVGRYSAASGAEDLAALLSGLPAGRDVLVVGENDPKPDGKWPGREGADLVAAGLTQALGREVKRTLPPAGAKDVRAWAAGRGREKDQEGDCLDAWHAAGQALLADLVRHSVSVSALRANTDTESAGAFRLTPCSELRSVPEEALWVWDGFLGRGVATLLSALMKAGKTTVLAHLLEALGKGGTFLGRRVRPCRVLYVTEESEAKWAERRDLLKLGDHITFTVRPFAAKPDWAQWQAFLGWLRATQARQHFDVIVFDTISNLWPVRDENDAAQVQSALMPLHGVIAGAALALIHHFRKSDGSEGTGSRGSGALMAWVDIIVELRRFDPADHRNRRRVLTGYGRYDQTPAQLVINLTEKGYVAEGDRAEVRDHDVNAALQQVMPKEHPGKSVPDMLDDWPHEGKPNRNDLFAVLRDGCKKGRWVRTGKGRKGDPYLYHRAGGESRPGDSARGAVG